LLNDNYRPPLFQTADHQQQTKIPIAANSIATMIMLCQVQKYNNILTQHTTLVIFCVCPTDQICVINYNYYEFSMLL
jgi:hypothetical protein